MNDIYIYIYIYIYIVHYLYYKPTHNDFKPTLSILYIIYS